MSTGPVTTSGRPETYPPVPFDSELAVVLDELMAAGPSTAMTDPVAWRRQAAASAPDLTDAELSTNGYFAVSERVVPGPDPGQSITLLICTPTSQTAPVPVIYFVHGGGMVAGTSRGRSLAPLMLDLAAELELAVVSVEYRLAPEHPHPAPVEDCYAGLVWLVAHAAELGIDPARVVVAGASAGGGLAAAVVLLARDRGGPALAGQILRWPMLDDRNDSCSAQQMTGLGVWDSAANQVGWTALLGPARGSAGLSPYAAPARAQDLSGLPPTFIDVGSAETFRDEAVAYASQIWRAGGSAELHVWPGGYHGFVVSAPRASVSRAAKAAIVPWLRRVVST